MTLIDKETIRKEIERRKDYISVTHFAEELLDFLDTLPDEPNHLEEALELVAEYNLKPYRDGNAWCILLGKDIQSGICGFGDTMTETYLDFLKSYKEYQHPIGELLNGLQEPEVPKEICPRCIHYGEYCYQPEGGMQYKINENGVYDCTHFNEKEQPVEGLDVTDFCKPIDPGIAQCIADHWWEMIGEESTNTKPVEGLEEEIRRWIHAQRNNGRKIFGWIDMVELAARHFYDLGCRRTAVMYDDIEYERQMTEEAELSEDLEEEIERFYRTDEYKIAANLGRGFETIARHFAEWGEENAHKAIMRKADEVRDKRFDTDYEVKIEPALGFDLGCVNVYREGKLVGQYVEPREEKKLPDGLEAAAEEYIKKGKYLPEAFVVRPAFIAGAEWQKAKMMEEAVNGRVIKSYNPVTAIGQPTLHGIELIYPDKGKPYLVAGDKVKVIVIPEEK